MNAASIADSVDGACLGVAPCMRNVAERLASSNRGKKGGIQNVKGKHIGLPSFVGASRNALDKQSIVFSA